MYSMNKGLATSHKTCVMIGSLLVSCQLVADDELSRADNVVTVFENRGILTNKGKWVLEPSLSYSQSSSTTVAIEGFTIVPALVVGLINVSQVQRDTFNAALSLRYGLTERLELGMKVPYIAVEEGVRERRAFQGSPVDIVSSSGGNGIGDVEFSLNYQLNNGSAGSPYYLANFNLKSDTGSSQFDVDRRQLTNEEGQTVGVIFEEQPTGSGFWSFQTGVTLLYPTDPAVLYGNLSYQWVQKEDKGDEFGGVVEPGDSIGFGFGTGFSVNESTSFSLGFSHNTIFDTKVENDNNSTNATFNRIYSSTFLLGISQVVAKNRSVNVSLGIGASEFAPDVQLTVRMPFSF